MRPTEPRSTGKGATRDEDGRSASLEALSTAEACRVASVALSAAAAELRGVVTAAGAGDRLEQLEAAVRSYGGPGVLWLLGDAQLAAVAVWLEHRAGLLEPAPAPTACGDEVGVGTTEPAVCVEPAGHAGHHRDHAGLRWVPTSWTAARP